MGRIRILREQVINQIAAGEVVEHPTSVVKELVENSLDAGASHICVTVRSGGFQSIQVADDGVGMDADDAVLCFERHATSKLEHVDDFLSLRSMGFRGEALAAIASIAKVELVTAREDNHGVRVDIEGGVVRTVAPAGRSRGTTIHVRSLLYNVPARKKFQKTAPSSLGDIHKLLMTFALAWPEIGFTLIGDDHELFSVLGDTSPVWTEALSTRIDALFQGSLLQQKTSLNISTSPYMFQGYLGGFADSRPHRSGQYCFVNRRIVTSPAIASAVTEGYGYRLNRHHHPAFILHVTTDPHLFDVNVHPQKREIKFQEEERVVQLLKENIQSLWYGSKTTLPAPSTARYVDAPVPDRLQEESVSPSLWPHHPSVVGVIGPYLLLDGSTVPGYGEGIVWLHLRRAQELLLHHEITRASGASQGLLLPIPFTLSPEEQRALQEQEAVIKQLGFVITPSGKGSYLFQGIPSYLGDQDPLPALRTVLQGGDVARHLSRLAVRGKTAFMLQEALALWEAVRERSLPGCVTHTRWNEIETFFS